MPRGGRAIAMNDRNKTKSQLIAELVAMRERISGLEQVRRHPDIPREDKERHRILMENASDAIIVADVKGNFLEVNRKAADLLGYRREELVGMNPRHIHPAEELERIIESFSRIAAGEIFPCWDTQILRKDGTTVAVDITGAPIEYEGRTLVQGIFRDITDRKQAEEALLKSRQQLQMIADNLPAFVTYVDSRSLRYGFVNQAFADAFGMTPKQMIGREVREILGDEAYMRALPRIERAQSGERIGYENIVPIHGEPRWFNIDYLPEADVHGIVRNILVLAFDITERKRAEEEREGLILELREALSQVKMLSGLLPICASCKRIRNEKGSWEPMEIYIRDHSEADFSHGICPECGDKIYPEFFTKKSE